MQDYLTHYRDLLAISVIAIVNAGMCDYHVRNCPPSPQLTKVCDEVSSSSTTSRTRRGGGCGVAAGAISGRLLLPIAPPLPCSRDNIFQTGL